MEFTILRFYRFTARLGKRRALDPRLTQRHHRSTSFNEFLVKLYVKRTQFDLFDLRNAFRTTQNTNDGERYKNGNGAKCPAVF